MPRKSHSRQTAIINKLKFSDSTIHILAFCPAQSQMHLPGLTALLDISSISGSSGNQAPIPS